MKVFQDTSQPFSWRKRRTRGKKLGVISVLVVTYFCIGSVVVTAKSSNSSSSISNPTPSPAQDFPTSAKVLTTNFASLKNTTFKIGASKKYYLKYASSTTTTTSSADDVSIFASSPSPSATTTTTTLRTTVKPATSKPTAAATTTKTTSELPPPPPTPLMPPFSSAPPPQSGSEHSKNGSSLSDSSALPQAQPLIQEMDLYIPDQLAQGSDQFMNVLAMPPPTGGGEVRSDGGNGFMSPSSTDSFPQSFEKFGVQDSLLYRNEISPSAPLGPSGGSPFGNNGEPQQSNFGGSTLDHNFEGTPQQNRLATTFQHTGSFNSFNHQSGVPPQPTSGGAYQFPSNNFHSTGGSRNHETNPFSPNPNPNVESYSPYSTLVQNKFSPGNTGPQHVPSSKASRNPPSQSPSKSFYHQSSGSNANDRDFGFAPSSSVPNGFSNGNTVPSHSSHSQDSWHPKPSPYQQGPVYPGHSSKRNERLGKQLNFGESTPSHFGESGHFGGPNHQFGPNDAESTSHPPQKHPSFLGSFDTGDMPNMVDETHKQSHPQENIHPGPLPLGPLEPALPMRSLQGFEASHTGHQKYHSPSGINPDGFQSFDAVSSAGASGTDGEQHPHPQQPSQGHEPDFQNLKLNSPPFNEFNVQPIPHQKSPPSRSHSSGHKHSKRPGSGLGSLSAIEQGFGDFTGFGGSNLPAAESGQANSAQVDNDGFGNGSPHLQNSPQFPVPSTQFDITQQGYLGNNQGQFQGVPNNGAGQSQPGFGDFSGGNNGGAHPQQVNQGFNTGFQAFSSPSHIGHPHHHHKHKSKKKKSHHHGVDPRSNHPRSFDSESETNEEDDVSDAAGETEEVEDTESGHVEHSGDISVEPQRAPKGLKFGETAEDEEDADSESGQQPGNLGGPPPRGLRRPPPKRPPPPPHLRGRHPPLSHSPKQPSAAPPNFNPAVQSFSSPSFGGFISDPLPVPQNFQPPQHSNFGGISGPQHGHPGGTRQFTSQPPPGFVGISSLENHGPKQTHPQSSNGFGGFSSIETHGPPGSSQQTHPPPPQGFNGFSGPPGLSGTPHQHPSTQPSPGFGGNSGPQHSFNQPPPGFPGFSDPFGAPKSSGQQSPGLHSFSHGPSQQSQGPNNGFAGGNNLEEEPPQNNSDQPTPGFGGFSSDAHHGPPPHGFNGPNSLESGPDQHQPSHGSAGFPGPNDFGPAGHQSVSQGFGGFEGPNHADGQELFQGPPNHPDGQGPPNFGGFHEPNHNGGQESSNFGGFQGHNHPSGQDSPNSGEFNGPNHSVGQQSPGFGAFSNNKPPTKGPQNSGQSSSGFSGHSEVNQFGPSAPQFRPPGFGKPDNFGPLQAPQHVQHGQHLSNNLSPFNNQPEPPHHNTQNSHPFQGIGELQEILPAPAPPLEQPESSPNHDGPPNFSPHHHFKTPQGHFSQSGPVNTLNGFSENQGAQHGPQTNQSPQSSHPSDHPGFQEFGNFPGKNADLVLTSDDHPPQGSPNQVNYPPSQSPQVVKFQAPPQVVTFGPPQVGFQDTETSASHEHSVEQHAPEGPGFMGGPGFNGFGPGGPGPFHHEDGPSHHHGGHNGPQERPLRPIDELEQHHPGLHDDSAIVNIPGAGFVGGLRHGHNGPHQGGPGPGGPGGPSSSPPSGHFEGGSAFGYGPGPIGIGPVSPGIGPGPGVGGGQGHHDHHHHPPGPLGPIGHHPVGHHKPVLRHKPKLTLGPLKNVLLSPLKLLSGLKVGGGGFKTFGKIKAIGAPHKPLGPINGFGGGLGPVKGFGPIKPHGGPLKAIDIIKKPIVAPLKALGGIKHAVGGIKDAVGGPVKGFVGDFKKPGFGVGIGHGHGPLKGLGLVEGLKGLLSNKKFKIDPIIKQTLVKSLKVLVFLADKIITFYADLAIPKDHYLRVLSFAGIYLFFAWLLKDSEHILYPKCEKWGWNGPEEFTFHAPARFVPAPPVDQHLQQEFLDLFRGVEGCLDKKVEKDKKKRKKKKKDKKKKREREKHHGKNKDNSSSQEDDNEDEEEEDDNGSVEANYRMEIGFINDMCPRGQFFYSMSPYHIEAWTTLSRMFSAQKTPADVLHLARELLYDHSVNPKVWYFGLQAAAVERRDMTGFQLAHPIDALPDLFIPGHLIEGELHRYRGLVRRKRSTLRVNGTSTIKPYNDIKTHNKYDMYKLNGTSIYKKKPGVTVKVRSKPYHEPATEKVRSRPDREPETEKVHSRPYHEPEAEKVRSRPYHEPETEKMRTKYYHELETEKVRSKSYHGPVHVNGTSLSQLQKRMGTFSMESMNKTVKMPVVMEKGKIHRLDKSNAANATLKDGKTLLNTKGRKGDEEEDDDGDSDEEDDETDNDEDSDEREQRLKNKHPLGYGHGFVGDGYGSYKQKQQNGGGQGGGLFGNGGLFGGNRGKGKDKDKSKEKGKGKGKGKGKKKDKKKCIIVDGSVGLDNGIENKLWYWREDMMLNQHHWYWHQTYPVNATMHGDRRAELFFFMHRSLLARYNAERLSNGFARTLELGLYPGAIIEESYNSHLKDMNSGDWWTPRSPQTPLRDIMHIHDPDYARNIVINDVVGLYNSFVKAIKLGKLLTASGTFLPIRFHEGIQPLANTIEATNISVNPLYYDAFGIHNLGHLMIGLSEDPDYSKKLPSGIMGEAGASMRDPAFYTYHTILDNLFEKFKQTLPPYKPYGGVWPLQWHGVELIDVKLVPHGGEGINHLTTFYIKHKFQLEPGVDRSIEKGIEKAEVCAVHLDHAPFQFQITIDRKKCAKSKSGQGTVRIFMAPRFNEDGHRLPLVEQRRLMFQLDAFQVELKVGRNLITRNSRDNSLTKPWSRSLKEYERGPDPSGAADYCGCGFPHHLYIPKGNVHGMVFDLFVMVTNFDEDFVADHPMDLEMPERCNSPYIFCGIPRRRYPDSRPMGYPFDRPPYHVPAKPCGHGVSLPELLCKLTGKFFTRPVGTLEEYVKLTTNMAMTEFEIKHIPKVIGKHYG